MVDTGCRSATFGYTIFTLAPFIRGILRLDESAREPVTMDTAPTPLLLTKLGVPPPHTHTLPRARLLTLVSDGPGTHLLLVSAPAGLGKTAFLTPRCHA